jgi:hypothetical protein
VVDGLKVLDPDRPIREADIGAVDDKVEGTAQDIPGRLGLLANIAAAIGAIDRFRADRRRQQRRHRGDCQSKSGWMHGFLREILFSPTENRECRIPFQL